jgi:hypothetical protein
MAGGGEGLLTQIPMTTIESRRMTTVRRRSVPGFGGGWSVTRVPPEGV